VIRPLQSGPTLLDDVRSADRGALNLWWLGQSGFLVAWQGWHLLLDPYLSDSLTRKYAGTDKPHERMTELVVDPGELAFVDVVTASHAHTDHLDPDTLRALPGAEIDAAGRMLHLGYVVKCGPFSLYHAGDTIPYDGMAEWIPAVDVALLPINGRRPERRVAGNLWGDEAAALAHVVGARLAVPMHFEMFAFNTEPPDTFAAACERLGQPYRVLRAGERLTLAQAE
jgi:L-ascorbate metabolism protein UlaG (beta-lactamase superfamily)